MNEKVSINITIEEIKSGYLLTISESKLPDQERTACNKYELHDTLKSVIYDFYREIDPFKKEMEKLKKENPKIETKTEEPL